MTKVNNCSKEFDTDLYHKFCWPLEQFSDLNDTSHLTEKDYECDEYFMANEANIRRGIKGIKSGVFGENVPNNFHEVGDAISSSREEAEYNLGGKPKHGYILNDITTSFTILIGIYFPSVTGNQTGARRQSET